jgi:hypothetical protein
VDTETGSRHHQRLTNDRHVESPVPSNEHAGFGRGPAGNGRRQRRYRARGPTSRVAA